MKKALSFALTTTFLLSLSACSGGGKCEKAMDKAMTMVMDAMKGMAGMGGGDADKMMEEMKKEIAGKKGEAVKACQEALSKDKAGTEKALDCVIAAKGPEDLQKCGEGASFMNMK